MLIWFSVDSEPSGARRGCRWSCVVCLLLFVSLAYVQNYAQPNLQGTSAVRWHIIQNFDYNKLISTILAHGLRRKSLYSWLGLHVRSLQSRSENVLGMVWAVSGRRRRDWSARRRYVTVGHNFSIAKFFSWYLQFFSKFLLFSGGDKMTIGQLCKLMMSKLDWWDLLISFISLLFLFFSRYGTLFPRIPVPVQKNLEEKLREYTRNKLASARFQQPPLVRFRGNDFFI